MPSTRPAPESPPAPDPGPRILVAGISSVGKTTLGRELGRRLGLPYTEMDELFHGPGWVPRPSFVDDVRALAAKDAWITEWQHDSVRPMLLERATALVWLDYSRALTMSRSLRRSAARTLFRRELFNGNRETLRNWLEPDHPSWWVWAQHARKRAELEEVEQRVREAGAVRMWRFRRPREAAEWVRGLGSATDHVSVTEREI